MPPQRARAGIEAIFFLDGIRAWWRSSGAKQGLEETVLAMDLYAADMGAAFDLSSKGLLGPRQPLVPAFLVSAADFSGMAADNPRWRRIVVSLLVTGVAMQPHPK